MTIAPGTAAISGPGALERCLRQQPSLHVFEDQPHPSDKDVIHGHVTALCHTVSSTLSVSRLELGPHSLVIDRDVLSTFPPTTTLTTHNPSFTGSKLHLETQ